MGFLSRLRKGSTVRATAIVVEAGAPLQNVTARHPKDWVVVVADLGTGPRQLRSVIELDRERWLIPGMQITIEADPDKQSAVHAFTVDWELVPTIGERVTAQDPTLTDPRAARSAALMAQRGASALAPQSTAMALAMGGPATGGPVSPSPVLDTSGWSKDFEAALAEAQTASTPDGKIRAVVIVVAMRLVIPGVSTTIDGRPVVTSDQSGPQRALNGNETVLSVNVPGRAPYAVFEKHLHSPRDKPLYRNPNRYPWLPAVVAEDDPEAVEILWDEVPDQTEQEQRLFETGVESKLARARSVMDAYQQAGGDDDPRAGAEAAAAASDQAYGTSLSDSSEQQASEDASGAPPAGPQEQTAAQGSGYQDAGLAAQNVANLMQGLPPGLGKLAAHKIEQAAERLPSGEREQYLEMLQAASGTPPPTVSDQAADSRSEDAGSPQPSVDLGAVPEDARHAAEQLAAKIKSVPRPMRAMVISQAKAGLESLPPETRDQYLELYRSLGIPV